MQYATFKQCLLFASFCHAFCTHRCVELSTLHSGYLAMSRALSSCLKLPRFPQENVMSSALPRHGAFTGREDQGGVPICSSTLVKVTESFPRLAIVQMQQLLQPPCLLTDTGTWATCCRPARRDARRTTTCPRTDPIGSGNHRDVQNLYHTALQLLTGCDVSASRLGASPSLSLPRGARQPERSATQQHVILCNLSCSDVICAAADSP